MRGIAKIQPPANVSPDGQDLCSLSDRQAEYLVVLETRDNRSAFARGVFDGLNKRALRVVMYQEQGSICIYCESEVHEGNPIPSVEHWRALSIHPELALDWRNLYLSCAAPETCEARKGKQALRWVDADPHLPWPSECRYQDLVGFTSLGEIYVRGDIDLEPATQRALELAIDDCDDAGLKRSAILNLNHPSLVAARAAAIDIERDRLSKEFNKASMEERNQRAEAMLARNPLPSFVSIRVAWLRKELGRGQ
jgi:uncharacterized protein (TIGR02646 family)